MDCPHQPQPLVAREHHGHAYAGCDACGGRFIGKGLLHDALGHARDGALRRERLEALPASAVRCPADGQTMHALVHEGIEIDVCPQCDGVWLDAGEFEAITQRRKARQRRKNDDEPPEDDDSSDGELIEGVVEFVGEALGAIFDVF